MASSHKSYFKSRQTVFALALCAALHTAMTPFAMAADDSQTATPIKHVVVIFQENVSFDHYFATYPHAANPAGSPVFRPQHGTPSINGLTPELINNNPNSVQPFRLDRSQAMTCDMDHRYTQEQQAADAGLMDKFVQNTGAHYGSCAPSQVMGYYDGNTVTALWNYAQHFAMSDNSFSTTFGPSTPGALNLVAGQTHGVTPTDLAGVTANGTVISDADPAYDDCSNHSKPVLAMSGTNVGNLLNNKGVTWGWFQGGFRPTGMSNGKPVCGATSQNIAGKSVSDYSPHHEPFQYYASTSNPHHVAPTSVAMIGKQDQANHQYDLTDFWSAAESHHMPEVSFLKAKMIQDGHAGYSDPLDEQTFLVQTLNRLQHLPEWKNTAVIIAYDDSDGWYDHVMPPIVMQSNDPTYDALTGPGSCGTAAQGAYQDRCGYGPRQPLLVISPYAKSNFVDHAVTDQSSILRFIEDNWNLGRIGDDSADAKAGSLSNMFDFRMGPARNRLFLDPASGQGIKGGDHDADENHG
ncbi:MAG: phospholipase C [Sulfuriferula sp.]